MGVRARASGVLFFPDQHLGRNTAEGHGRAARADADVEPAQGCSAAAPVDELARRPGHPVAWASVRCTGGSRSTRSPQARVEHPGVQVIVHPGAPWVVDAADAAGSTDFIVEGNPARPRPARPSPSAPRSTSCNRLADGVSAANDLLSRPRRLPVLDDVPHPPGLPRLGARGARRRSRRQPHHGARHGRRPGAARIERMLAAKPPVAVAPVERAPKARIETRAAGLDTVAGAPSSTYVAGA